MWIVPLAYKSCASQTLLDFHAYVKTQFERPIKSFQREFDNTPFKQFCITHGMVFRFSCPHTSSQNGKTERMIRTHNNISRTMLHHASLPLTFWDHALETATYLHNTLPTKDSSQNYSFIGIIEPKPPHTITFVFLGMLSQSILHIFAQTHSKIYLLRFRVTLTIIVAIGF